jgi:hypothetical protein
LNAISKTIATVVATVAVIGGCFVRVRAETPTSRVVGAANAFLSTLDDSRRQRVVYSFDDSAQRARWSNFPTGVVPRGGIALKDMTPQQQAAAMNLLATVLSPQGLEKVQDIREADDDFKADQKDRGTEVLVVEPLEAARCSAATAARSKAVCNTPRDIEAGHKKNRTLLFLVIDFHAADDYPVVTQIARNRYRVCGGSFRQFLIKTG